MKPGLRPVSLVFNFDFHSHGKIQALALQFITVIANTRYKGREQDPLFPCLGRSFSVLILLIALNGFLVMAELAIVSSRPARLQMLANDGRPGALAAMALNADSARFLPSVQIGITVVAIISGAYGEHALSPALAEALAGSSWLGRYAETVASTIVVSCIAYVSLVIGELVPKRIALANRERIACSVAPAMTVLAMVATPISALLRWSTDAVLHLVSPAVQAEPDVTEEEVKSMIAEGTEAGVFEKAEQEIIERLLRVADRSVRSIMVPRPDIVWLDITESEACIYNDIASERAFPVSGMPRRCGRNHRHRACEDVARSTPQERKDQPRRRDQDAALCA